ncbi:DEP domain-containing protein 1A-like [Acropora millepora]|uniref:DEP domain-containing protein 1A-like n=1 Tax=Acropora millepora TaxID=45264 RepID=UPI001CF3B0CF|nr:DEP domain-containing protein 1A-like [Acropora millepora]
MDECKKPNTESDNMAREPFKATKIWNDLVEHLRTNVEHRRRRWKFQYYENCFRGGDVIEVLHSYIQSNPHLSNDATRDQVRCFCQILLEKRIIECVTTENSKTKSYSFEGGNKLYRFSSHNDSFDHNSISSPSQDAKKLGRRRSGLGQWDHKAIRRRSLGSTPKAQKRFADLLLPETVPSPAISDPSVTRTREIPSKRRRLSLDAGAILRKNKTAMLSDSANSKDFISEIWFEIALSQILQLTEVPFLEEILAAQTTDHGMGEVVLSNNMLEHGNESSYNKGRNVGEPSSSACFQAGIECMKLQNDFPLPQLHVDHLSSYVNLTNAKEAGIQQLLLEYYGSLLDSLIPSNLTDLVNAVISTLVDDWSKIKSFLPLLALMLSTNQRKHLKNLLNFIGRSTESNGGRYIIKRFTSAILPKDIRDKNSGQHVLSLMVRHHQLMFATPTSVKELFQRNVYYMKQGLCPPFLSKVSRQLSVEEYQQQKLQTTNESLSDMMAFIMDNLHMSLKEKEERLKVFQKHHTAVFLRHFPDGEM